MHRRSPRCTPTDTLIPPPADFQTLANISDTTLARRISASISGVKGKALARYVDGAMCKRANYSSPDPVVNWSAYSSFQSPTPSRIYDRYPLISEPIYGLHVRKSPQPAFLTPWYGEAWKKFLA